MWNEVFDNETAVGPMPTTLYSGDSEPASRPRVNNDTDVSIRSKLDARLPKCLLTDNDNIENRFVKRKTEPQENDVTKTGKRVIRKRLSISEFNASRLRREKAANRASKSSPNRTKGKDDFNSSSSSDNDTLPKNAKKGTDVLSAKIQHLLSEMQKLRSLDRDILRRFLVVNATIEEQRWAVEEKQEEIKRTLSEEGEDPVAVNFDLIPEVLEDPEDDEESIQSVLSRHNSLTDVFNDTLIADKTLVAGDTEKDSRKDSGVVSSSSDSALSMSGDSSNLSSTTSLPASNRSLSPPTTEHSIMSSVPSSCADQMLKEAQQVQTVIDARTDLSCGNARYSDDVEDYFRLHGVATKRVLYPFQKQDAERLKHPHFDDSALDSIYPNGCSSTESRKDGEKAMNVRRMIVNRSQAGQFHSSEETHSLPRSRSGSMSSEEQRAVLTLDGAKERTISGGFPVKRSCSLNGTQSAASSMLQHPSKHRHLGRMSTNRQLTPSSFVPIAELESDTAYENGRLYSSYLNSRCGSSTSRGENRKVARPRPPAANKSSMAGSARLPMSSSRASSTSLVSSCPNSSLNSASKYVTNEAERYHTRSRQEPVWVPRRRHTVQTNESIPVSSSKTHRPRKVPSFRGLFPQKSRAKVVKRASLPRGTAARRWVQAQDDVTFL